MNGSAGVRTLNYGSPVNWAAPLNRDLTYWWRVLPLRTGGNTWWDLAHQQPAAMGGMLPVSSTTGFSPTQRPGGAGELGFNGTTSWATTGLPMERLGFTTTVKMVAAWVLPLGTAPTVAVPYSGVCAFGDTGQTWLLARAIISAQDRFWAYGWSSTDFQVGVAYTANQWTHWAYVHTGGNLLLYKNGALGGTVAVATIDATGNEVFLGATSTMANLFQGAIDDVRFMRRAPSANEIAALYQASLRGYPQELRWQTWPPAFASTPAATGHGLLLAGRRNRLVEVAA